MKLKDLTPAKPTVQVSKVFESYFGSRMSFDELSAPQCRDMLSRVRKVIGETRRSPSFHKSEQNPAYLKLVMMEQALAARLAETMPAPAAPAAAKPAAPGTTMDPKLKAAQDKIKKGMTLTPEEQKMINDSAAAVAESKLRRAYRMLKESEVQQAQVVLAAQDMVDKMQGMLEDVSELQFKELPALVDSIKNQVGIDQATQFNQDATAALTGLLQNIQGAKQQLDAALGVVTGQTSPADAGIASIGAPAEPGPQADLDAAADLDADAMDDLDAAAAAAEPDAEPGAGAASLGRSRR